MVNTVIVNGNTYTDDGDPVTGLAKDGHRGRLVPMLSDSIAEISALKVSTESAAAATLWVSGVDGSVGESKISPVNLLTYRRIFTGAFTTDPSLDPTNWKPISYVGKQSFFVPASAMTPLPTLGASIELSELVPNATVVQTLNFSNTADEYAQFSVMMPNSWNIGTLTAQFLWLHGATTVDFGVRFFIQAKAVSDGETLVAAFGTAIGATADTGGTTSCLYKTAETAAITVANTPSKLDTVIFQIYRDVSDVGDTLAIDAKLFGVMINYTTEDATDD